MGYFLSILLCTLVLEDVALASSLALVSQNKMSIVQAFLACTVGITVGDIALYLIGYGSSQIAFLERYLNKYRPALQKLGGSQALTFSIIVSRAIPGARIPTYLGAGILRYSPVRFFWLTVVTVLAWVFAALFGGRELIRAFVSNWVVTLVVALCLVYVVKLLLPKLTVRWQAKTAP